MRKVYLALFSLAIVSCAPMGHQQDRLAEAEIKISKIEQKQLDAEKDLEKTNERIDKLTEMISELRLELEKIKLKLGISSVEGHAPEVTEDREKVPEVAKGVEPQVETQETQSQQVEAQPKEDAESAYKKAIELYSIKKLYEARDAFLDFIKKFPENKYTDNAFFWIGKIYQELGKSRRAEEIYKSLVDKCEKGKLPDCNKLPDAYYQLMKIYSERGDMTSADNYYSILIDKFPTSDAAVRAREYKTLLSE